MRPWLRHHHWHFHRDHTRVIFTVGNFAVELRREEITLMATTEKVGQTLPMSISYLDQHGNPMATQPTPDSPPSWAQSDISLATLAVADGGETATIQGLAPGDDVVTVSVQVGGAPFTAQLDLTVEAEAQVLTSIAIVPGTPA